jgi:hypothetical protein
MKKRFSILSLVIFLVVLASIAFAQKLMSLAEIKEKATRGDAVAQYNLGGNYELGCSGVKKDLSQAKYWYEKAAAQGLAVAQYNLGLMYATGNGVKQDLSQAKYWYEKAAAQGDAQAQFNLGIMYYKGEGVKQDLSRSKFWYEKAAAQNDTRAIAMLKNKKGDSEAQSPAEFAPKPSNKIQIFGLWKFITGKPIITNTEIVDINKDGKLIINLGTFNLNKSPGSGDYGLSIQGNYSIIGNNQIKLWFPSHFNRGREETLDFSIKGDILILGKGTYKKSK